MIAHVRTARMSEKLAVGGCLLALGACAHAKPAPQISLDTPAVAATPVVDPPKPVEIVQAPVTLPLPGQLKPMPVHVTPNEPVDPRVRIAQANAAARVQPSRWGYLNATQVWPFAAGALYQLYTSPGEVTDVTLEAGEQLVSVSAGDTVRWVIGNTTSGKGSDECVHILVKPTRPANNTHADEALAQNGQDQKAAFLGAATETKVVSNQLLQTPASPYQLMAGTLLSAAMVTGLNSDLPGECIATITEPVYDTVTGRTLLIPQGSRLLGQYDSHVTYGQSRILLVWNRIVMPDGASIVLDRLPATDPQGYAGVQDRVDNHWGKLLAGAALSTLLGVGAELGSQNDGLSGTGQQTVVVATSRSAEDSLNQVGQQITRRNLNVQPTLTVRPGFPVRVIVNKDLVLRPYGAEATMRSAEQTQ